MSKFYKVYCFLIALLFVVGGLKAQMDVAPTNGTSSKKQVIQNKRLLPLDFAYNLADSITAYDPNLAANGNAGIVYFDGEFWVSKWASNEIVILDSVGTVDTVITIGGLTGARSFTTDGVSVFAGNATDSIYAINPVTKTLDSIIVLPSASVGSRMTTYDASADNGNGGFWIANFTSDIELYSRAGVLLQTIAQGTHAVDGIYGGAVDTITAGGPYLALFNQGVVDQARIDYIEIATGLPAGIVYNTHMDLNYTQATNPNPAIAGGLFISDSYNPNHQVIMGVLQGLPDVLFGYENLVFNCAQSTGLTASPINATDVQLSWTPGGGTNFKIEYGPVGFTPGSGTVFYTSSSTDTITGLLTNSSYDFYVEDSCSVGQVSFWSGPATASLGYCLPAPISVDGNGITNVSVGSINNPTGVEPNNYGDYSYLVADVNRGTSVNVDITFSTGWTYETEIWVDWNMDMDFLDTLENVYTGTSLANNPTTLNASFWVPLTATMDTLRMRIGSADFGPPTPCYTGSYGSYEDYSINILAAPSCIQPTNLTATNISSDSAVIGWTENNLATEWIVEYGTMGFTPGAGTIDTVTMNPISITGLSPNTNYEFYVRSICGRNDSSLWTGPFQFITECASVVIYPYFQGFNSFPPACWELADNGQPFTGPTNFGFSAWYQDDFMNDPNNGDAININLYSTGKEDWVISEPFDLSVPSAQPYQIRMKVGITNWASTAPGNMDPDDEVQVLISTDGGLTWSNLYTWNASNQPTNPAGYVYIPLGGYTGNNNLIALWGSEGMTSGTEDIQFFVDDFEIRETPTCQEATSLSVNNIGSFTADLSWQENNSATEWHIEYGTAGFTLGAGIDSIVNSNPKTLSGLNPSTDYEFYVRSICAPGDTSLWMGPFPFRTLLPPCAGTPNAVSLNVPSSVCAGIGFELNAVGATIANGITYEWQIYDSTSSSWVSAGLVNASDSVTTGIFVASSYRFISQCSFSGMSDTSSVAYITINDPLQCYCVPTYNYGCASGDDINSVTLTGAFGTSINDLNTGCSANDYDDKTSLPPVVMEIDSTYSGTITSSYMFLSEYANIWIDFGDDGNFDPSDLVTSVGPFSNIAVPFNITIPLGVDSGFHRMRIRNVYGGSNYTFDACSNENWGEAHDYMVYIGTLTPCSGLPDPAVISAPNSICASEPFTINVTGMSFGNGISYVWEESVAGTNVWNTISGATSASLPMPGGITDTMLYRMITICSSSGLADTSNIETVTINPITQCYCDATYTNGCMFDDDINSVTLIGVNSTSISDLNTGCSANNYDDKTYLPATDLVAGMTHFGTISSTYGFLSEYAKVWIDFDDDGFFDATDSVGQVGPFSTSAVPFTISLPSTANSGLHRMRIRSVYNGTTFTFDACSSYGYGEVHDYMVNVIIPTCPVPNALQVDSLTHSTASLSWIENGISTEWQVEYGLSGFMLGMGTRDTVFTKPVSIGNLLPETTYQFYVRSVCGRNDTSFWAGPFSFTTPCFPTSTYPYIQTFGTFMPNCWMVADEGEVAVGPSVIGTTDWFQNDYLNNSANGSGMTINLYSDFHRDWIISEPFDLSVGTSPYQLLIDAGVTDWLGTGPDSMGVDDEVQVLISTDQGVTWNNLYTWTVANQPINTGTTVIIPLNSYTGNNNLFAIWASDGIIDDTKDYEFHITNFMLDVVTGVDEFDGELSNISIYPNPSNGTFHIVGKQVKEEVEISIFSTNGQLVYQSGDKFSNNFDKRIDISGFAKGLYFVKLQSKSSMEMKKIVIQ